MSERTTHPLLREVASAAAPGPAASRLSGTCDHTAGRGGSAAFHAAAAAEADTTRYRRRVLLVLSSIALALFLYWASGYFFAYTDDAYVTSDFVSVAPYISGRIVSLNIVDNQTVKKRRITRDDRPDAFPAGAKRKAG